MSEDPLTNPEESWYTYRSSFVLDGKRRAGYAVVSNFEIIEAKPLPPAVKVPGFTTHESSHGRKQTLNTLVKLQHAVPVRQRYKTSVTLRWTLL